MRALIAALACSLLAACASTPEVRAPVSVVVTPPPPVKVGIALGGGAAKGFAHIGVIKMLEANGIRPVVVSGTSAGSVVGALYASGMDAYALQEKAFALDESKIRDVSLFSGGVVKGQKLQDYVNDLVGGRTIEKMARPFAAVATRLEDGQRTVFVRGNTGQAVRASSSIPGVFEAVPIGKYHFVDGNPPDTRLIPISRTIGATQVVDDMLFCFTHTSEIDWMLPGIAPTGKPVEIPLVAIVKFRGDKLYHEHIYWDQASVLVQIGKLDPKGLPVAGAETARKLLDEHLPSNTLMANWASSEGR